MCTIMTDFNNIQDLWNAQPQESPKKLASEYISKAKNQQRKLTHNHYLTIGILFVTVAVLIFYFFWVSMFQLNAFTLGLSLMIIMLVLRITLELQSATKLRSIHPDQSLLEYAQKVKKFYEFRKKIHFVLTPIIYISYFIGFSMLLPTLKIHLSNGFYLYCIISGYGFFVVFCIIIIQQIIKEMKIIELLNQVK